MILRSVAHAAAAIVALSAVLGPPQGSAADGPHVAVGDRFSLSAAEVAKGAGNVAWVVGADASVGAGVAAAALLNLRSGSISHVLCDQPSSYDSQLTGVSVGRDGSVTAVGYTMTRAGGIGQGFVEQLVGGRFRLTHQLHASGFSLLYAVDDLSSTDIWVVGESSRMIVGKALVQHFNGTAWSVVKLPKSLEGQFSSLRAIAGSGKDLLMGGTVGSQGRSLLLGRSAGSLVMNQSLDGRARHRGRELSAILVHREQPMFAAGASSFDDSAHAIFDIGTGSVWRSVRVPHAKHKILFGIASDGSQGAWAVGYGSAKGEYRAVAYHFAGGRLTRVRLPPANGTSFLTSVVRTHGASLVAVGSCGVEGTSLLVMRRRVSGWHIETTC